MPRTVADAKIETKTSRAKLKRGRQAHWRQLRAGVHLGYQIWDGDAEGRWLLRRYLGGGNTYRILPLGRADDAAPADGSDVLSFDHALAKANDVLAGPGRGKIHGLTVRQALDLYAAKLEAEGREIDPRGRVHILPVLGDLIVSELDAAMLRKWLSHLARSPAQKRPKGSKPQYRKAASTEEEIRRRQSAANRVLNILKAALNHAYDEGHVPNNNAWGRRLAPFKNADVAKIRFLSLDEAERLINASEGALRSLVRAALETGARYSELCRLQVHDFNARSGTVHIRRSKSGKQRHIVLTESGATFFKRLSAGRAGDEPLLLNSAGTAWAKNDQSRPLRAANRRAKIAPPVSIHALRHTWASLAVERGVPLQVVAENLGHADIRMTTKHYAHLTPDFRKEEIRRNAPVFNVKADDKVISIR